MDKEYIYANFGFTPSINQLTQIERLLKEICRREDIPLETLTVWLKDALNVPAKSGKQLFTPLRQMMIKRRFPLTSKYETIAAEDVFLPKIEQPVKRLSQKKFIPEKIFIEQDVAGSELAIRVKNIFPDAKREIISSCAQYSANNKYSINDFKSPVLFLVREKWDFFKACPCTPQHVRCGYWILNLGFGCPYDCSYCYLQQYANFPGIILPANLKDFFDAFDEIDKKLTHTIRIGTGEFTDSLALDDITEYSKKLIPYFAKKNVLFELKTKSANIKNLLEITASKNIIISWSLNPQEICQSQELFTATLKERLEAAKECHKHGYSIAFHFDPIIHTNTWEAEYQKVIDSIYTSLAGPFKWISLGTLRCQRNLKTISEQRFPESDIFYSEMFLGKDKKLRYPEFLREEIYKKMVRSIRDYDKETPVYLCMESEKMWEKTGAKKP